MYEETDSPDPEGEYDDEDNDLVHLDNGARVPDLRGAVGDHSVGFPCHRDHILNFKLKYILVKFSRLILYNIVYTPLLSLSTLPILIINMF